MLMSRIEADWMRIAIETKVETIAFLDIMCCNFFVVLAFFYIFSVLGSPFISNSSFFHLSVLGMKLHTRIPGRELNKGI